MSLFLIGIFFVLIRLLEEPPPLVHIALTMIDVEDDKVWLVRWMSEQFGPVNLPSGLTKDLEAPNMFRPAHVTSHPPYQPLKIELGLPVNHLVIEVGFTVI